MPRVVLLILLLLGISVATTGCIQMEHELQIPGNGTAVYRLQYAISEPAVTQWRALLKLQQDLAWEGGDAGTPARHPLVGTFLDPSLTTIREQALALEPYGITIRLLRENPRPLWRDFSLTLDIADMARLPDVPFFAEFGFSIQRNREGQYVLERPPVVDMPGSIPPRFSPYELEQIRPFLGGFNAEIKIKVPGRIISTTAGRTSLQTAIWNFNFDRQPESLHQLLQQPFHVVFQGPETGIPVFDRARPLTP
jgi:hypothetical protein